MSKLTLQSVHLSILPVAGVHGIAKSTVSMALPMKPDMQGTMLASYTVMEIATQQLGDQIRMNQTSEWTGSINVLEIERNNLLREIISAPKTFLNSIDPVKKAAALLMKHFIDPYKATATLPQDMKSGIILELVAQYKARPDLMAAAIVLGIASTFLGLETKNADYISDYMGRIIEYSEQETSATSRKPATIEGYTQFCIAVQQSANLTPTPAILALFHQMNELRKTYHALQSPPKPEEPVVPPVV